MDRVYIFSYEEFWVLLKIAKINRIIIFEDTYLDELDDHSVALAFSRLIKKGFLINDSNRFALAKDATEIVNILRNRQMTLQIEYYNNFYPQTCLYIKNDRIVQIQPDYTRTGNLKISVCDKNECFDELINNEFLNTGKLNDESFPIDEYDISEEYCSSKEAENKRLMSVLKYDTEDSKVMSLYIIREPFGNILACFDRDQDEIILYSGDRFRYFCCKEIKE